MRSFGEVWKTTIFQKWVMAVTGILLVGFLVGHVSGNMLIFLVSDAMNGYAEGLRELLHGTGLIAARLGLIVIFILHIWSGVKLARLNRASKGPKNSKTVSDSSSMASRTMIYSGFLILFYVIYHLAHFTNGMVHTEFFAYTDSLGRHDVYRMVVESFQQPVITITYVIAMIVTGFHLNHAISSAFQTLGISHPRYTPIIRMIGPLVGMLLVIAFSTVPIAIIAGLVK